VKTIGTERRMDVFSFAHLSDPHLPLAAGRPSVASLLSKRLPGYLSWRRKRRLIHRSEILAALIADIKAWAPDHTVITGDLANIALPDEFVRARAWLEGVGDPGAVTIVPGNHDTLVTVPWAEGLGLWRDWMAGDSAPADGGTGALFPSVRVRGPVAFVGLNSGLPTAPLLATGAIGSAQMSRAEAALADLGRRGLFRVLLVHHPVAEAVIQPRKALTDRRELQAMLNRAGAELVLHGHTHYAVDAAVPGPCGPIPTLAVPSASAIPYGRHEAARWHGFQVVRGAEGWDVTVTIRILSGCTASGQETEGCRFVTSGSYRLRLPAAVMENAVPAG